MIFPRFPIGFTLKEQRLVHFSVEAGGEKAVDKKDVRNTPEKEKISAKEGVQDRVKERKSRTAETLSNARNTTEKTQKDVKNTTGKAVPARANERVNKVLQPIDQKKAEFDAAQFTEAKISGAGFSRISHGKEDLKGNAYLYRTDTATINGKKVQMLVAYSPVEGLQYKMKGGEWRHASESGPLWKKYGPQLKSPAEKKTETQNPQRKQSREKPVEKKADTVPSQKADYEKQRMPEKQQDKAALEAAKFKDAQSLRSFGPIAHGATDSKGNEYVYRGDTLVSGGKKVPVIIAFSPSGGIQYRMEKGEWKNVKEGGPLWNRYVPEIAAYRSANREKEISAKARANMKVPTTVENIPDRTPQKPQASLEQYQTRITKIRDWNNERATKRETGEINSRQDGALDMDYWASVEHEVEMIKTNKPLWSADEKANPVESARLEKLTAQLQKYFVKRAESGARSMDRRAEARAKDEPTLAMLNRYEDLLFKLADTDELSSFYFDRENMIKSPSYTMSGKTRNLAEKVMRMRDLHDWMTSEEPRVDSKGKISLKSDRETTSYSSDSRLASIGDRLRQDMQSNAVRESDVTEYMTKVMRWSPNKQKSFNESFASRLPNLKTRKKQYS